MNELFEQYYQRLEIWSESASAEGWISGRELVQLKEIERQQAEAIFSRQGQRPLIVAFFGGTGVGKSSLLNRLAGEKIARAGVERPTSHEMTLYLHTDYRLGELPADLPLDETRVAYHSDDQRRLIAWLDMPDFDSVEEHHRDLVQAWLPYVDWLIYVISPGRYQDDIGWRFVQQRGGKHSWLFVMNQWDQGQPEQIDHLRLRLQQEGFSDPVILRTSCLDPNQGEDDFSLLEKTINGAIATYGLELLQQLGVQARLGELQKVSEAFVDRLEGYPLEQLETAWKEKLSHSLAEVKDDLTTNALLLARSFQDNSGGLPWRVMKKEAADDLGKVQPSELLAEIWSSRIDTRMNDLANELENLLQQRDVPSLPFASWLQKLRVDARSEFQQGAEGECTRILLQPGGALRRGVCRLAGWLSWTLPLAASGWAVYHLVIRFYQGTRGEADFLGLDYAIHSTLLILLSWLLPWLLQRKLKPGASESIAQALAAGSRMGLKRLEQQGDTVLAGVVDSREYCVAGVKSIVEELSARTQALTTKLPWSR